MDRGGARGSGLLWEDPSGAAARRSVPVRVRVGSKGWTLGAMLREVAADPPGLFLSPFFEDATLESWRAGEMRPAQGDGLDAAAMLFRSVKGEWVVHVEVAESEEGGRTKPLVNPGPSLESVSDGSRVRIWLGPVGAERQIEIRRGGVVTGRDAQGRSFMPTCDIGRSPGTWSAAVTVPRESIESGGLLRIGIECFRADGGRCAFPRPMVPWQDSPGRVAVQTADW